jgi:hypothetical protein|tara:strand:- start:7850 stop:8023 length:174 start_codon:yes stop_codon:yes gene_type:complete
MSDADRIKKLERRVERLENEPLGHGVLKLNGMVMDAMQVIADKLGISLGELYDGVIE